MKLPASYQTKRYLFYELIGAVIVLILLILKLARPYISYHWFTDTLWWVAAILLVVPELTKEKPLGKYPGWLLLQETALLLVLYLFLYHFFILLFSIRYITFTWLLHAGATVLYGTALFQRAEDSGIAPKRFDWKNLLRYPHWPLSIALSCCMLAPFFKMSKIRSIQSSYGLQFGYDYNYGYGYNSYGYNYYTYHLAIKGYQAYWGHFACILLAFLLLLHLVKAAGKKEYPALGMFFRIAIPVIFTWWLLGAKGYETMKSFGNILFLPGILLAAIAVYMPGKLGEWVKKKDIINRPS